jgi:hypothetical protein
LTGFEHEAFCFFKIPFSSGPESESLSSAIPKLIRDVKGISHRDYSIVICNKN